MYRCYSLGMPVNTNSFSFIRAVGDGWGKGTVMGVFEILIHKSWFYNPSVLKPVKLCCICLGDLSEQVLNECHGKLLDKLLWTVFYETVKFVRLNIATKNIKIFIVSFLLVTLLRPPPQNVLFPIALVTNFFQKLKKKFLILLPTLFPYKINMLCTHLNVTLTFKGDILDQNGSHKEDLIKARLELFIYLFIYLFLQCFFSLPFFF